MKRPETRKILSIALACVCIACLLAAGFLAVRQWADHRHSQEVWDSLRPSQGEDQGGVLKGGQAEGPSSQPEHPTTPEPAETPQPTPEPVETPRPTPAPVENPYGESFRANADMAAWLQIPGTDIDYPVMWTPRDEEYYLYRGFDGGRNQNGCLILDTDSCLDPLTTNLIIHGHNMESGAMFGSLPDYEDYSYFEDHRQIILHTKEQQRNYEVIAVFRSQVYKKTDQVFKFYKFFQADTEEEFDDFYQNIKALSLYDTGGTAQFGDHFLTLSTCVYHVDRGRLVVVAKEVEPGDSYLPPEE